MTCKTNQVLTAEEISTSIKGMTQTVVKAFPLSTK